MTLFPGASLSAGGQMTKFPTQPGIALDFYGNPIGGGAINFIPGVVADGSTDNYATINTYLNSFIAQYPQGGNTPLILPPGQVALSQTLVPPANVILNGSGNAIELQGPLANGPGTYLIPTASGFVGNQVVRLDNVNSGIRNCNVWAKAICNSAVQVNGDDCIFDNCSCYGGLTYTLDSSQSQGANSPRRFLITGVYVITPGTSADTAISCLNATGNDWIVGPGRFSGGTKFIGVGGGIFTGIHFTGSSNGSAPAGLYNVVDGGGSQFDGCYVDSVAGDGAGLIQRIGTADSIWSGCHYFENTPSVTNVYWFDNQGTGVTQVIGGWAKVGGAGSTFLSFLNNPTAGDNIHGVTIESAFQTGGAFYTVAGVPGGTPGVSRGNIVAGVIQPDIGFATGSVTFSGGFYQLALRDMGTTQTAAGVATIQIPANATVPIPVGSSVTIIQTTAGKVTISPNAGVTMNAPGAATGGAAQFATMTLTKLATNVWYLSGDIA